MTSYPTTTEHSRKYRDNGFVKLNGVFNVNDVSYWVDEISRWPKVERKWLVHWEKSDQSPNSKQFCRAENFVNYHEGMRELADNVGKIVEAILGEPVVLFKEKINYKLPGGSGFSAHLDSPAYLDFCEHHVSAMIMVDECTPENGSLQCSAGVWTRDSGVPLTDSGVLTAEYEASLDWEMVLGMPGDLVLFDGWTPHRSEANYSGVSRRAIFLTYNLASYGNFHAPYYELKHANAQGFDATKTISFQGDFQGEIVD